MPHNAEYLSDGNETDDRQTAMNETFDNEPNKSHKKAHPKELVEQGISFLSGLAKTLKSPEATAALVDSITEKTKRQERHRLKFLLKVRKR